MEIECGLNGSKKVLNRWLIVVDRFILGINISHFVAEDIVNK